MPEGLRVADLWDIFLFVHSSFLPCHMDRCLGIFRRSYLTTCLQAPFTGAEAAREASPRLPEASMRIQIHERQRGMP